MVDFDDLLDLCRSAMSTDRRFADAQRWRFRHLFVDEFQDVNPLQFMLLTSWLDGRPDLCVVGDPNQAIYAWNGADADYLNRFTTHFPGAAVVRLRQNYRSTSQVLRTAAAVLVGQDPMLSNRGPGPDPVVEQYEDHEAEARGVVRRIRDLKGPDGRWSDHAILVRTNAQTEPMLAALRSANVPFRTRAGSGLLDRADVKAQLKALGRSDSPVADRMADLRTVELSADTGDDPEGDTGREAAFAEIRRMADEFLSLDPGGTGRGFVAWVWSQGRAMADDSTDAVEVSTFHAAKGLEWPIVHVAGLEQGLVPIAHARDADALAEERRLLYVALTRAEDRLFLTWAARRSFGTRSSTRTPSMWLPDLEAAIAGLERPLGRAEGARRVAAIRERSSRAALPDHPVVTALRDYRSTAARAANVPPYVVFNDATLIDLITTWPSTVGELLGITGIGPTKADRHGAAILAILAVNDRPDPLPITEAPSEPAPVTAASFDPDDVDGPGGPVYEALRAWRSEVSRSAGIPAYRVFNNRTLDALVELRPADLEGLLEVPGIGPRTVEAYGEAILMAITGAG
jgi:DNA helicase-2/ATP-dependent DNA helicase PcrA